MTVALRAVMLKHKILVAAALGALGTWSARSALAEPGWCKGASFDRDLDLRDLSSPDAGKAVVAFAHAVCAPTAEAKARLADIEKTRAAWGKRLGMAEADWADVIAWKATGEGRNIKIERSTKDLTKYTPIDQYLAFVEGFPPLEDRSATFENPIYIADILDMNLSEVGRYAYIEKCLAATTTVVNPPPPPAATWALCQYDIDHFDMAKFHAELRADTAHKGDIKMKLRFQVMDLKKRLAAHAEKVQKAWQQDPVYKRMFEIAAAARTEWVGGVGKNTELLALVQRMNAALWSRSRKAMEGCEAPTEAALRAALGKIPASTFKGMKDQRYDPSAGFAAAAAPALMTFPEAALAAEAYTICHKGGTSNFLYKAVSEAAPLRGPRMMGFARMLSEKLTLDNVDEKIYWPDNRRPFVRDVLANSTGGVVAKASIEGDKVVVKLEKLIEKSWGCVKSHYGKRIVRINPDGKVDYELICDEEGELQWDQTWSDFHLDKKWAPLLKKGVKFSISGGDVIALWPNGKSETPNWFLGVNIK